MECSINSVRTTSGKSVENLDHLNEIEGYGISVTTLEEVFLKVASSENPDYNVSEIEKDATATENSVLIATEKSSNRTVCGGYWVLVLQMICQNVGRICISGLSKMFSFIESLAAKLCCCETVRNSTFWIHFKALMIKRALSARRDQRIVVFQLLIPVLFLFFGLLSMKLKPHPDQDSVTFSTSHFNPLIGGWGGGGPIPFNLSFPVSKKVHSYLIV